MIMECHPVLVEKTRSGSGVGNSSLAESRSDKNRKTLLKSQPETSSLTASALKLDKLCFVLHNQLGVHPTYKKSKSTLIMDQNEPLLDQRDRFLERFFLQPSEPQPSRKSVPVPSMPVYRERCLKSQNSEDGNAPLIQFSIFYDVLLSKLVIQLHQASNLPVISSKASWRSVQCICAAYVTVQCEPDREQVFQTEVVDNSRFPIFNQCFQFEALSFEYLKLQTLVLCVFNSAQGNKAIGKASLPLSDMDLFGAIVQMKLPVMEEMEVIQIQLNLYKL